MSLPATSIVAGRCDAAFGTSARSTAAPRPRRAIGVQREVAHASRRPSARPRTSPRSPRRQRRPRGGERLQQARGQEVPRRGPDERAARRREERLRAALPRRAIHFVHLVPRGGALDARGASARACRPRGTRNRPRCRGSRGPAHRSSGTREQELARTRPRRPAGLSRALHAHAVRDRAFCRNSEQGAEPRPRRTPSRGDRRGSRSGRPAARRTLVASGERAGRPVARPAASRARFTSRHRARAHAIDARRRGNSASRRTTRALASRRPRARGARGQQAATTAARRRCRAATGRRSSATMRLPSYSTERTAFDLARDARQLR